MSTYHHLLPDGLLSDGLSVWSLDTFNLTLPSGTFLPLSDELKAKEVIQTEWDAETGELYLERKKTKAQAVVGSSGTKYVMVKDRRTGEQALKLELTSKSLKSLYLVGVTLDTLPLLHRALMEDGIASFSMEELLLHSVTDFDYQRLFLWKEPLPLLSSYYQHLSSCYIPSKQRGRHFRVFGQVKAFNVGFDLNERRHTKHIASAHLKAYYKGGELLSKEEDIVQYVSEIPHSILTSIHRQELTISGKEQAQALGLSGTTLAELIRMPQELITGAQDKVMEANFTAKHMKPQKATEGLTGSDERDANYLTYLLPRVGYLEALEIATESYPYSTRKRKADAKAKVRKIAELLISQGVKPKPISDSSPEPLKEVEAVDFLQRVFGR